MSSKDTPPPLGGDGDDAPAGRSVYEWDVIENYEANRHAVFRSRAGWAFGVGDGKEFFQLFDSGRAPLDWKPEIFAYVAPEKIGGFMFGT